MRVGRDSRVLRLFAVALFVLLTCATPAFAATTYITTLQPSYTAPGGGGCYAAYYGPPSYPPVSPGSVAPYLGRDAGIIKAGITVDPVSGDYEDEGLLGFQVASVPVATFATQALTYDVANQYGALPIWVRIRLVGGIQYQHVPTSNPAGWHTVNAAAGMWQLMDSNGNAVGPQLTLAQVAAGNPGASVDRVYLTSGMGNSYHDNPNGTVGWVDTVVIGATTYDFVVTVPVPTNNVPASSTWSLALLFVGVSAAFVRRARLSARAAG